MLTVVCNAKKRKMRLIAFIFFILFSIENLAQEPNLILTEQENIDWFNLIEDSPLDKQVCLIKNRLLSDTNIFIHKTFPDRIILDRLRRNDSIKKSRVHGYGKPMYVFRFKSKIKVIYFENLSDSENIKLVAGLMIMDNYEKVESIKGEGSSVLYGSNADCGVITLFIKNRKTWTVLNKLKLYNYFDKYEN